MKRKNLLVLFVGIALLLQTGCGRNLKNVIRAVALVVSAISVKVVTLPDPRAKVVGVAGLVGQVITLVVVGKVEEYDTAPNRPDPEFSTVAEVDPVHFNQVPGDIDRPKLPSDVNAALKAAGEIVDNSRLVDMSLRKYYGALNAGNAAKAESQRAATCEFLFKLDASIQAYSNALAAISDDAQGTGFASASTTVPEVLVQKEQIGKNVFPPEEEDVLTQMHATTEERSLARVQAGLVEENNINPSDLTGAAVLVSAARLSNRISIQDELPVNFSCSVAPPSSAPTLTEWGVLIMTLLLLTAGMIFIARRRPVLVATTGIGSGSEFTHGMSRSLFVGGIFARVLAVTFAMVLIGFGAVTSIFGPVSTLDVIGALLCALILSYLIHLLISAAMDSRTKSG